MFLTTNTQTDKLISIIIPVYNTEAYLEKCITSLLQQTYTNYEIIIIDDGSEQSCAELCDQIAKLDKRIQVIHQENTGQGAARNVGLDHACGDYLYFIDSDDYIHPQMLEFLIKPLIYDGVLLSYCQFNRVYDESIVMDKNLQFKCSIISDINYIYENWHSVEINVLWNKLFSKKLFDDIRFPIKRINEDEFIKPKLYSKISSFAIIDLPLYFYRQRAESTQRKKFSLKRLDKVIAIDNNIKYFKQEKLKKYFENELEYFVNYFFAYIFQAMFEKYDYNQLRMFNKIYRSHFWDLIKCSKFNIKFKYMLTMYYFLPKIAEKRYGASYRREK